MSREDGGLSIDDRLERMEEAIGELKRGINIEMRTIRVQVTDIEQKIDRLVEMMIDKSEREKGVADLVQQTRERLSG